MGLSSRLPANGVRCLQALDSHRRDCFADRLEVFPMHVNFGKCGTFLAGQCISFSVILSVTVRVLVDTIVSLI